MFIGKFIHWANTGFKLFFRSYNNAWNCNRNFIRIELVKFQTGSVKYGIVNKFAFEKKIYIDNSLDTFEWFVLYDKKKRIVWFCDQFLSINF